MNLSDHNALTQLPVKQLASFNMSVHKALISFEADKVTGDCNEYLWAFWFSQSKIEAVTTPMLLLSFLRQCVRAFIFD